jgi:hypothetical protein
MLEPELGICMVACDGKTACAGELDCLDGWCGDPDVLPCDAVKGLSDDWLRLFNHGVFKWGVGGSDAHGLANFELGCLRNYVRSDTDSPVAVSLLALEQEMAQGHSFLTYGPFVELTVDGKGPGETVEMGGRKSVELRVRVQAADWFDVSRVELLRNGRIEEAWDVDAQEDGQRLEVPHDGVVVLDAALDVSPAEDSWYVAVVAGLAGRTMQPVYGSLELPPVYLGDLFQAVFGSLPISLPSYMTAPKIPVYYPQFPFAVTNPVILDVDGKDASGCAFTPPEGPPPEWACDYPEDYPAHRIPCVCN